MSNGSSPSVFVSSTCYDLSQIRQDLKIFIESLGMEPFLSETHTFPVNSDRDAVSNCLSIVKNNADIFVLIVGCRYGSVTDGGKSITNLEYTEAKDKGIPRYVFIQKSILNLLPVWESNPNGDFSKSVDSTDLFNFIKTLRDPNENWVFPFESAQDIITTLRVQFGYLYKDALGVRTKYLNLGTGIQNLDLTPVALKLLAEKPSAWEYLFFGQVLSDELAKYHELRRDLLYGIRLGEYHFVYDHQEMLNWIQCQLDNISLLTESLNNILNTALQDVLRPPGMEADVTGLAYAANRFGHVYKKLLEWIIKFHHIKADDSFSQVLHTVAQAPVLILKDAENFPERIKKEISSALSAPHQGLISITLVMNLPDDFLIQVQRELDAVSPFSRNSEG